ncbi:MAG TPA: NAD(+) synthase [Verrucomicrobiae bacterium]|nr:NAD(+) synthase [Verrucomicrobiae bacterium]
MNAISSFSADLLKLDCALETERITTAIREKVWRSFRKKGVVVALSGGIDSSVVGALAVKALGPERVLGLLLPERDSAPETFSLGRLIVRHLGIKSVQEEITGILESLGCYERRDDAIRIVIPEYGPDWKSKIVLPSILENGKYRLFSVVAESPDGSRFKARTTLDAYLGIVAATNFKQRVRKMLEYYHADRLNFAVAGTPNRLEYELGFFVKLGDGAADIKPIAHLYKSQVYQLAEFLELPEAICSRPPTTDTYSLAQTQEEFYFSMPLKTLDLILFGSEQGFSASEIAREVSLTVPQVEHVLDDIKAKRRVAQYLHAPPATMNEVALAH